MPTDDESGLPERSAAPRRARRAAVVGSLAVFTCSVLVSLLVAATSPVDGSALLGTALMAALVSGAVLVLLFVLPKVGSDLVAEPRLEDRFDDQSWDLLDRAENAVGAIAGSQAQACGLLDGIANAVVLREQTAEIVAKLAVLSDLRRGEREVGAASPAALARLERQQAATDEAATSLARRVEALESYAGKVAELDALLRESAVIERLDERDALIAELVAETARDQPAVEDVDRLARGLPAVADELERRLRAVREGGQRFLNTD